MMSVRQSIQKPIRSRVVASSRLLDWPLTVIGLYVFTLAVVTFRFPVAEVGIAIAVIGLFLQASAIRTPLFVWIYAGFVDGERKMFGIGADVFLNLHDEFARGDRARASH